MPDKEEMTFESRITHLEDHGSFEVYLCNILQVQK